jgi:hypothetical protein
MVQILSTNTFTTAKWIVDPTLSNATHTTIQAAINSAASGDDIFIRPGTYTENLTLKVGVNLTSFTGDAQTPTVTIVGTCTLTTAGTVNISNIRLQTNAAALIAVTGSAASVLNINNCYLNCTNATGITFSSSSATSIINLYDCLGNLGTTGIGLFAHTSAGLFYIFRSRFTNTGSSVTASTCSGYIELWYSYFQFTITTSGAGAGIAQYCHSELSPWNTTAFTIGGGLFVFQYCYLSGGTARALTITGSATLLNCEVSSSNATSAITGSGTLNNGGITFAQNGQNGIDVTTQAVFSRCNVSAYVATTVNNVTGDGTNYTIIFNTETSDIGNDYNNATGVFTAPYTGNYLATGCVTFSGLGAGNTLGIIDVVTSLKTYPLLVINPGVTRSSTNESSYTFSGVFFMNAGNTLSIRPVVTGGGKVVGIRQDSTVLGIAALN